MVASGIDKDFGQIVPSTSLKSDCDSSGCIKVVVRGLNILTFSGEHAPRPC